MSSAAPRQWSIQNRLAGWIAVIAAATAALTVGLGSVFLHHSVTRELDALVREEVEEARLHLLDERDPVVGFAAISHELAAQHPSVALGWWLLDPRDGRVLGAFGETRLLAGLAPFVAGPESVVRLDGRRLASGTRVLDRIAVTLVADGAAHEALVSRFQWWASVASIIAIAVAAGAGWYAGRRVSRLLASVADSLAVDGRTTPHPGFACLPREISAVAASLVQSLTTVREGAEEFRLFMAGLAHELRSPVQNMISEAEVALMRHRERSEYTAILERQIDELTEFSDAVDNLLAICRSTTNPGRGVDERFDLADETRARISRDRRRAERAGIRFTLHHEGDATIVGDREDLMRSVRNVVANAIDWTSPGGSVDVRIEGGQDVVSVTVDDDGPGIDPAQREVLFRPFERGVPRQGRRIGYGLGLAMTKRAMDAHGGTIEVGSSPRGGARLLLRFRRERKRLSGSPQPPERQHDASAAESRQRDPSATASVRVDAR